MGGPGPQGRSRSCPRALGRGRRLRGVRGDGGSSRPGTGTRRQSHAVRPPPRGQEEALQPQAWGGPRQRGACGAGEPQAGLVSGLPVGCFSGVGGWGGGQALGNGSPGMLPGRWPLAGRAAGPKGHRVCFAPPCPRGTVPRSWVPGGPLASASPHTGPSGPEQRAHCTGAAWVTPRHSGQSRAGTGVHVPSLGRAGRRRGARPDVAHVASPDTDGAPIRSPSTPDGVRGTPCPRPTPSRPRVTSPPAVLELLLPAVTSPRSASFSFPRASVQRSPPASEASAQPAPPSRGS